MYFRPNRKAPRAIQTTNITDAMTIPAMVPAEIGGDGVSLGLEAGGGAGVSFNNQYTVILVSAWLRKRKTSPLCSPGNGDDRTLLSVVGVGETDPF